jgi:hypothetical protein
LSEIGSDDWGHPEAGEGEDTAVAVRESAAAPSIIRAVSSADVSLAITEYQRIQQALDKALPDCIMQIQGRSFRKKDYWRAVATAFNLQVEEVVGSEHRTDHTHQISADDETDEPDWTISVTYRASASNGRTATGDGACSSSEKWGFDRQTGAIISKRQATYHNVRAHAHTRAYNRAVSNLVGFGEVSAEEIHEAPAQSSRPAPAPPAPAPTTSSDSADRPAWLDDPLKFGKHKAKTWRHFLDGAPGGEGEEYLEYLMGEWAKEPPKGRMQETKRKVEAILDMRASEG